MCIPTSLLLTCVCAHTHTHTQIHLMTRKEHLQGEGGRANG